MFSKILIANRGEIAVRVIRTAKELGYSTVAVFSEADRQAPHVALADEAVCIGPAAVGESYLVAEKIIEAAKKTNAGAVHPGYGFLSENSGFSKACAEAGIVFIGPPAEAIELMGSKRLSKIAMLEANVPCIPGYEGADQDLAVLLSEAKRIGFPIMVKASAGGGGRGMRLVHEESELESQINTARSEAENAFGSGELILERAVISPRHIEIQVFADQHGNAVYLGERDCSIQRRHQKVVEEAPSPFVDPDLRARMGEAAVQAAKACSYVGAGTVEFLVDQDKNFYFLEMNTRLQVEHPVTEIITGTDLVEWQINVAAGDTLPLTQEQVTLSGHAIEVRLYAEDPRNQFLPQTGNILRWTTPDSKGMRIDSGICEDQNVSPFYDPMLAKLIAYGSNREEARRRLQKLLRETVLFGVTVNTHFLSRVLDHDKFVSGEATTAFIEQDFAADSSIQEQTRNPLATALACVCLHQNKQTKSTVSNMLLGWSNSAGSEWPYTMQSGTEEIKLLLQDTKGTFTVREAGSEESTTLRLVSNSENDLRFEIDGVVQRCAAMVSGDDIFLRLGTEDFAFSDVTHVAKDAAGAAGNGKIQASMDGAIIKVFAQPGQEVTKGETLVILEAMKMEHPLKADVDGTVSSVLVNAGDQVKLRQLLVEVEASEETNE